MNPSNRKALVLGGTSGIGLATALQLKALGATVIVFGRSAANLDAARAQGLDARAVDVLDRDALAGVFAACAPFDILVNAATGGPRAAGPFLAMDLDAYQASFQKLWGYTNAVRLAAGHMPDDGTIVLVSGAPARRPRPGQIALCSVGGAVEAFVRGVAGELAPRRINVVSPGIIDTPMFSVSGDAREKFLQQATGRHLIPRAGTPDEVAQGILFAITNDFVTGTTIDVDGGWLQKLTPMPGTRYRPSRWLRNPHLQTMLGSVARRSVVPETERTYLDNAVIEDITTCDGTVLRARVNRHTEPAPQVVLIHGWLGNDGSSYVRSAGARLWQAGFNTVRMNLRDHGDTEELNQDLYNSARTVEVVDLVDQYRQRNAGDTAVIGFSLGGNFALRVARDTGLPALAVCPAIDPGDTLHQIDHGPGALVYRNYFVRKWRASLVRKAQAFPARYDFSRAFTLRSVSALTDFFVRHHSDFSSTATYFDAYDLSGNALAGVSATILAAKDDPIIPHATIRSLPRSLDIVETDWGGHNAFLSDWSLASWCDEYVLDWCRNTLGLP